MAEEKVGIKVQVDTSEANGSVGSLKKQLKEAQNEVVALSDKFGATSKEAIEAAKRAADLKDRIGDARALTDAFNPDAKFKALSSSLAGVAGGFSALQGAIGLFGEESKEVEKQILKVQSALALSEGLQTIGESVDSFRQLGAVIKTQVVGAFNALKAAIGSTGIGLLVIALGAIAANWDKIKASVTGVSKEQEKLNAATKANVDAQKKKLDAIGGQENILKLQGKSEKQILELKLAQTKQVIAATKEQIKQNIATLKAQVEAEARNKKILKGILDFINQPVELLLKAVGQIAKLVGVDFNFSASEFVANLVFDPEQVQAEGQAAIAEQQAALQQLENNAAGYQLQIQDINKKAAEKNKKDNSAELSAQQELIKAKQQNELNAIKDDSERRKKALDFELENETKRIKALKDVDEKTRLALLKETEERIATEKAKIDEENQKKQEEQDKVFQKQLAESREQNRLAAIQNEDERAIETIKSGYKKQLDEILANEKFNAEQKAALKAELQTKEAEELAKKQDEIDKKNAFKELERLSKLRSDEATTFEAKLASLETEQQLLQEYRDKGIVTEEEYNAKVKALTDQRISYQQAEMKAKMDFANAVAGVFGQLGGLFEKGTAASKVAGLAEIAIGTGTGFINALDIAQKSAKATGPGAAFAFPIFYATQIAAVLGAASRAKAVLSATRGGGSSSSSAPAVPSVNAAAPITPTPPQATLTQLNDQSINQLGSATSRAYVLESDVSNGQERIRRINRAARLG